MILWHKRMPDIGDRILRDTCSKKLVHGLEGKRFNALDFYYFFIMGKQKRVSFSSSEYKSENILDFIHSKIYGPMEVTSMLISTKQLPTLMTSLKNSWVFFMKKNDEALEKFKTFVVKGERQIGNKVKVLRTNNGDQYFFENVNIIYRMYDIVR